MSFKGDFGENEFLHLGTKDPRANLRMNISMDHLIFWQRMSNRLKDVLKSGETED